MRVIQTKNDTIRLIFNPKTDGLSLSDFLIVRDGKDNFLGQVVEVYDDKFNQEENVACIRLVFRILQDCQIVPYDNFTPSRECEIAKIKIEEIEKCLNTDKTPVPFGISTKNGKVVSLNTNFFDNCPVVFADKLEQTNAAFENLAQKLKSFKKVVAIDFTGNLTIKNSKRIRAGVDFRMPLDFYSLDYIWQKGLGAAPIETLAKYEEIFIELKKFAQSTEEKFVPFQKFVKVIEQLYKQTPAKELHLLLMILKKFKNEDLFARSKKDAEAIQRTVQRADITIIDMSCLKIEWHKEFLEFALRALKPFNAYFLLRLNDHNSSVQIINNLYTKHPNLSIISSISYGFKKLPQVMEYAKNYILYKTLNPRRDFGFANFQIAALNSASFLAFGEDTQDFMFVLNNYIFNEKDIYKLEDKKLYIDLDLGIEQMTPVELQRDMQKRLEDEVGLEDVLNAAEVVSDPINYKDAQEETQADEAPVPEAHAEGLIIGSDETVQEEEKKEFLDIPLVAEETAPVEAQAPEGVTFEEVSREEFESQRHPAAVEAVETPEETKKEGNIIQENGYTLEEVDAPSRHSVPDIVTNHLDEAVTSSMTEDTEAYNDGTVVVQKDSMADLIEASLKNDEMYIKELELKAQKDHEDSIAEENAAKAPVDSEPEPEPIPEAEPEPVIEKTQEEDTSALEVAEVLDGLADEEIADSNVDNAISELMGGDVEETDETVVDERVDTVVDMPVAQNELVEVEDDVETAVAEAAAMEDEAETVEMIEETPSSLQDEPENQTVQPDEADEGGMIPLAEDDLDYFANPVDDEGDDSSSIEAAIQTAAEEEELADQIEAQSRMEALKKNSEIEVAQNQQNPPTEQVLDDEEDSNPLIAEAPVKVELPAPEMPAEPEQQEVNPAEMIAKMAQVSADEVEEEKATSAESAAFAEDLSALKEEALKQAAKEGVFEAKEEEAENTDENSNVAAEDGSSEEISQPETLTEEQVEEVQEQLPIKQEVQLNVQQEAALPPQEEAIVAQTVQEQTAQPPLEEPVEAVQPVVQEAAEAVQTVADEPEPVVQEIPVAQEPAPVAQEASVTQAAEQPLEQAPENVEVQEPQETQVPNEAINAQPVQNAAEAVQNAPETRAAQESAAQSAQESAAQAAQEPAEEQAQAPESEPAPAVQAMPPVAEQIVQPVTEPVALEQQPAPVPQPEAPMPPVQKPGLVIEDYSQEETAEPENQAGDGVTLADIAKKSIEARFDEVIGEDSKGSSRNKLKINENVSIDLEQIKNNVNVNEPKLPIFNEEEPQTEDYGAIYAEGMTVVHEKYGKGVISKVVKYSNRCLLQIEFEGSGKRLLDPKMANITPVE